MKHFKNNKKGMYMEETFKRQKQIKMAKKLKAQKREEEYENRYRI
jgi:hypothetical protein